MRRCSGSLALPSASDPRVAGASSVPCPAHARRPREQRLPPTHGWYAPFFGNTADLGKCDNSISSMVILGGHWEFFDDDNFKGTKMGELGPGVYLRVQDHGLKDNSISSIRLVSPMGR